MARRDFGAVKLGKKAARHDPRTLQFGDYLEPTRAMPPPSVQWSKAVKQPWGMMKNDEFGDCTIAGVGHGILLWTSAAGQPQTLTDEQVVQGYVDITTLEGAAFDPKTGANDNGCVELDVLNYWRNTGFFGH